MLLSEAHDTLGWPTRQQIVQPQGAGPRIYADFARRKIGAALQRKFPGLQVEVGVLSADPNSDATEAPLAVACEFKRGASDEVLDEAHRLAWNFSRTALLVTLEPHRILAWSCYQPPTEELPRRRLYEPPVTSGSRAASSAEQRKVRDLLHWVHLINGHFLHRAPESFPADGRADVLLMKNLRIIRRRLRDGSLPESYCHDLLARIIFTQFLFHRKGGNGRPFFDDQLLANRCEGALREVHSGLTSILADKDETYALFRWLDGKFNGDLFPGHENQSAVDREQAWEDEKAAVKDEHLRLLADFVSGKLDFSEGQLNLWPSYSFDVIPLEFISSVYEEFLSEDRVDAKAYYTPPHLVDFVLDAVLPWNGERWDLKILDPACGSGIFLVKAFQRLIHRWRQAHPDREPRISDLKPILANNIFGVDRNPEAVRVACFSLYLTLADAIEPKYYLRREKVFPRLRGTRLIPKDFFDEETPGFRTAQDARSFDLVIGNAPWGDGSIKETSDLVVDSTPRPPGVRARKKPRTGSKAELWAQRHGWSVANKDIGPLFLSKGAALLNDTGRVALIQPASLLYQRAEPARELRRKLFSNYTFEEISNFSALRRELFSEAIGPACVLVFGKSKPDPRQTFLYITPKPLGDQQARHRLVIEPYDINRISHEEAVGEPVIWSALALGGRRDLGLISRLSSLPTLSKLESEGRIKSRLGVIPGNKLMRLDGSVRKVRKGSRSSAPLPDLRGKPYFDSKRFPEDVFLRLEATRVAAWQEPAVADSDSVDFEAFKKPQLLIKISYSTRDGRFRAVLVDSPDPEWGVICKKTYMSVRDMAGDGRNIQAACIVYNSLLATYHLFLTSSRVAYYTTEATAGELLEVPLPPKAVDLSTLTSFEKIDEAARHAFDLTLADWTLVEDLISITLQPAAGYDPTSRSQHQHGQQTELATYAETFIRVLKSTFSRAGNVCATVFEEPPGSEPLPVRMVAVHLDWPKRAPLQVEQMEVEGLMDRLQELYLSSMQPRARAHTEVGLGFKRIAFLSATHPSEAGPIRSLYIIKPDQRRYWSRSLALRDADQLSHTIMKTAHRKGDSI